MPSGEPVSEQILAAVETVVKTVLAPTYYTSVRRAVRFDEDTLRVTSTPMVAIVPEGQQYSSGESGNVGELVAEMNLRLMLVLKQASSTAKKLLRFERDVITAIIADPSLGGIAQLAEVTSSSFTLPDEREALAYSELRLRVIYRTPRSDLNTAT